MPVSGRGNEALVKGKETGAFQAQSGKAPGLNGCLKRD